MACFKEGFIKNQLYLKYQRKAPVLESLFDKVADVAAVLQKRESKNSNAFPLILKKKKKEQLFIKHPQATLSVGK